MKKLIIIISTFSMREWDICFQNPNSKRGFFYEHFSEKPFSAQTTFFNARLFNFHFLEH